MSFGENLVSTRKANGMTRTELAEKLGIPYTTLRNYETDKREPGHKTLIALATLFSITVDELIGNVVGKHTPSKQKTTAPEPDTAEVVANKYKRLDRHGKQVVCAVITEERRRMEEETKLYEPKEVYPINSYLQPASAGCGDFTDDDCFEVIDLVKRPPNGTSFLVTVDGDSMEPTYHDGDKVFVHSQSTLNVGDIGVIAFGSDMYIKEQGENCLISHNPAYGPKYPDMDTLVRVYGKVLGVCTDDYFGK